MLAAPLGSSGSLDLYLLKYVKMQVAQYGVGNTEPSEGYSGSPSARTRSIQRRTKKTPPECSKECAVRVAAVCHGEQTGYASSRKCFHVNQLDVS
jgi:hypothetical protein